MSEGEGLGGKTRDGEEQRPGEHGSLGRSGVQEVEGVKHEAGDTNKEQSLGALCV